MVIKPVVANLKKGDEILTVDPKDVKIGDVIIVKKGDEIPLDGIIIKGSSKLNTAALTGESDLKNVNKGDKVLSGSINTLSVIEIKVESLYEDSTVSKILELTENASDRKAKCENFVSKAAKVYTPIIMILALLIALILPLFGLSFKVSIYRALVFLVVSLFFAYFKPFFMRSISASSESCVESSPAASFFFPLCFSSLYASENKTFATNPAPPKISTSIITHSYIDIETM